VDGQLQVCPTDTRAVPTQCVSLALMTGNRVVLLGRCTRITCTRTHTWSIICVQRTYYISPFWPLQSASAETFWSAAAGRRRSRSGSHVRRRAISGTPWLAHQPRATTNQPLSSRGPKRPEKRRKTRRDLMLRVS
jgi:hypothetical protein